MECLKKVIPMDGVRCISVFRAKSLLYEICDREERSSWLDNTACIKRFHARCMESGLDYSQHITDKPVLECFLYAYINFVQIWLHIYCRWTHGGK